MGKLQKPLTIYMFATWFLFNISSIIMWVQCIGIFGWVQRSPWFPPNCFKSKKNEGILHIQRQQNGDFQRKIITQIGGTN